MDLCLCDIGALRCVLFLGGEFLPCHRSIATKKRKKTFLKADDRVLRRSVEKARKS